MKPLIYVATPSMRGPSAWTYNSLMYNLWQLGKEGIDILPPKTYNNYPLSDARNEISREFKESDATHLFSWDIDNVFYSGTLKRLLAVDKPVVSGFYLASNPEKVGTIMVFRRKNREGLCDVKNFSAYEPINARLLFTLPRVENEAEQPLVQVDGVGMGCILIRKEVFEKLEKPYFLEWSPIMPEDVHKFGEDLWFCDRLAQAEIPLYVSLNCYVGHEVTIVLGDLHLKQRLMELGMQF